MERFRPPRVAQAIRTADIEAIQAFARAGGKRSTIKAIHRELDREVHEQSMEQTAQERGDHLLPDA